MNWKWRKIDKGKTKIIYTLKHCGCVVKIESKDDITAGDGEKRDIIPQKGILANNTTCNIFRFLEQQGIRTHFITRLSERAFLAYWCDMIPLEVVVRRWATGSYLKRNPEVEKGKLLDPPVVELFLKDDSLHDPYVVTDKVQPYVIEDNKVQGPFWTLYQAKQPINYDGFIKTIDPLCSGKEVQSLRKQAQKIFELLEDFWQSLEVRLWDMKVEFGRDQVGLIRLGDVIDNDSWRITNPEGKQLDKQVYRDGEDLGEVQNLYQLVSVLTNQVEYPDRQT